MELNSKILKLGIILIALTVVFTLIEGSIEYFSSLNFQEDANRNIGAARSYLVSSIIAIMSLNLSLVFNMELLGSLIVFLLIILRIYLMVQSGRIGIYLLKNRIITLLELQQYYIVKVSMERKVWIQ